MYPGIEEQTPVYDNRAIIVGNALSRNQPVYGYSNAVEDDASAACEDVYETEGADAYNECYTRTLKQFKQEESNRKNQNNKGKGKKALVGAAVGIGSFILLYIGYRVLTK